VTHDQVEALSMSNRIAVMSAGHIVQEGRPREIYQRPATEFVAKFVGTANFMEARVAGPGRDGATVLTSPLGALEAVCPPGIGVGEQVTISIRPENVQLQAEATGRNVFPGTVEQVIFLGDTLDCRITVGGVTIRARQHPLTRLRRRDTIAVVLPVELIAVLSDRHGVTGAAHLGREDADADAVVA